MCVGKDCKKKGVKKVFSQLPKDAKKRLNKSDVRVVETKCLDLCKRGPNVIFDNEFYSKVTTEQIEALLKKHE